MTVLSVLVCFFVFGSFIFKNQNVLQKENQEEDSFECSVNGKEVILKDAEAKYRTITGGFKQLSISNDKFEAFVFINPSVKRIELSETDNHNAYVRYLEPGTDKLFKPVNGFVDIQILDLEKGLVSGIFEMEMVNRDGAVKKVTVKNGKFVNIPITVIKE